MIEGRNFYEMHSTELNKKISELRGYTCEEKETYWPNREMIWRNPRGMKVDEPLWTDDIYRAMSLVDDFQESYENGKVSLFKHGQKSNWACWFEFNGHRGTIQTSSISLTRAICEAWLQWQGEDAQS